MQKKAFDTMVALMRERLHHDERLCKALIPVSSYLLILLEDR